MAGLISIVVLVSAAFRMRSVAPLWNLPLAFALVAYGLYDEILEALLPNPSRSHPDR